MTARAANRSRNALATPDRRHRWRTVRDRLWNVLDPHMASDARVAIVGAGDADDIPLTRILTRARRVDLIDLDQVSTKRALYRESPRLRARARVIREDVTGGAADAIVRGARRSRAPRTTRALDAPIGGGEFVVHVHDALGWWSNHDPGGSIDELLTLPPRDALVRLPSFDGPWGCDVAGAVAALGVAVTDVATWWWPFADDVDYFVYALLA